MELAQTLFVPFDRIDIDLMKECIYTFDCLNKRILLYKKASLFYFQLN